MKLDHRQLDLTGQKYGKLTVIQYAGERKWQCACDCGGSKEVFTSNLRRGNTKSCGCIKKQSSSARATKHGYYHTKAYKSWYSIKRRCTDERDSSYLAYGGKGITMHAPWIDDPKSFCEYIGPAPSAKHSIDRIDNTKGYEPGNIRWATDLQQANNKTNNVQIEFQGQQFSSINAFVRWVVAQTNVSRVSFHRELARQLEDK